MYPYIHFQGNCAEAMTYYRDLFGGTDLRIMRYSDVPPMPGQPPMPATDRVIHSEMVCFGSRLMASDFPPGVEGDPQKAVSISLTPPTVEEARRLFDGLKDGGVIVEFGPSFFSPGFGMAKDRFGTHWIISTPKPE